MTDKPAATPEPCQWRPIETAPRVTRVLVYYECGSVDIARQINTETGWRWETDDGDTYDTPLGWMMKPTAPRYYAEELYRYEHLVPAEWKERFKPWPTPEIANVR